MEIDITTDIKTETPTGATQQPHELRRRAEHLTRLAAEIERAVAMNLPERAAEAAWDTRRARLCEAMLERNLHQLHRAADDLRTTALRFVERADQLDAAVGSAA